PLSPLRRLARLFLEGGHVGFHVKTEVDVGHPVIPRRKPPVDLLNHEARPQTVEAFPWALVSQRRMEVIAERHETSPGLWRSTSDRNRCIRSCHRGGHHDADGTTRTK